MENAISAAANDDEDIVTLAAPEGFRKVQFGSHSDRIFLYCVDCGMPAERAGPRIHVSTD
jgi:hypothetical protein